MVELSDLGGDSWWRDAMKALSKLAASLLLLLCCPSLFSQTTTGRVMGSVHDQSGAIMPGATIVITDVQRGVTRTVTTDQAGEYVAPDLAPGIYEARVAAKGFRSVERPNIHIEVAQDVRLDFTLSPGELSQTITVEQTVPLINTTSATLGGTISNEIINDLPLN